MLENFKKKLPKRLAVATVAIIVSAYIWDVNASWGNTFKTCLSLSTTTFLIIYTPFEIYWTFRDMWFDRWKRLKSRYLDISEEYIEIQPGKYIAADIVRPKNQDLIKPKDAILIVCHGFSDTKETLQYYFLPLALQGYTILTYDARGSGKSKKAGRRGQFIERIEDFGTIVDWIKQNRDLNRMKVYAAGVSIGAMAALCGGFPRKDVEKIIAISSFSNFKKNSAKHNLVVVLRYLLKGVSIHPSNEKNEKLSPCLVFKSVKNRLSEQEWFEFKKKVLLIHAKNDKVIKFKNLEENMKALDLSEDQVVVFKKGGHSLKKSEVSLVGASLRFLNA
ncbi:MAG: alpha/beta fold hydrolase [Candidatus Lokiarchaeota archaeon]|nr:alpha/beta fold hydrolase [Candidatus Lokiarchaeota archaeon]